MDRKFICKVPRKLRKYVTYVVLVYVSKHLKPYKTF